MIVNSQKTLNVTWRFKMTLLDFNKKELLEIYRALEYKRWEECPVPLNKKTKEIHNNLTQLMEKVSQARKMCTCKENVSE